MTTAREDILSRISAANRNPAATSIDVVPPRSDRDRSIVRPDVAKPIVDAFVQKALANGFGLTEAPSNADIVAAVTAALDENNAGTDITMAQSLAHIGWPNSWTIHWGMGRRIERVSINAAVAAIAETGSLVFGSSGRSPASLNYLPDLEIALLSKSDIAAYPEDVWHKLRDMHGAAVDAWPRAINVVSGASRTADVAGILVRPAHGPKHVHIILTP
jgi:L-lactate utilization protein LutC